MGSTLKGALNVGFSGFLDTSEFTDAELVTCEGKRIKVHKLLLALKSDFFKTAFLSGFREGSSGVIKLQFEDTAAVFPDILSYFYKGEILVTNSNCICILAASRQLVMKELGEFSLQHFKQTLNEDNVVHYLYESVRLHQEEEMVMCINLIAKGFIRIINKDSCALHNLPFVVFHMIVSNPDLLLHDEMVLYSLICAYISHCRDNFGELDTGQCNELFNVVRFPFLRCDQLEEISKNNRLVDPALVVEAVCTRLKCYESKQFYPQEITNTRMAKRIVPAMYKNPTSHSVIQLIGTEYYKKEYDVNIVRERVFLKSDAKDWDANKFFVSSSPQPAGRYIEIELPCLVCPSHYWLSSEGSAYWHFEASNNCFTGWKLLMSHAEHFYGDETKVWVHANPTKEFYKYFRIRAASNHTLYILSVDIWGEVVPQPICNTPVV